MENSIGIYIVLREIYLRFKYRNINIGILECIGKDNMDDGIFKVRKG